MLIYNERHIIGLKLKKNKILFYENKKNVSILDAEDSTQMTILKKLISREK